MLQLHLSDQQFNCLLKCVLYERLDGIPSTIKRTMPWLSMPRFRGSPGHQQLYWLYSRNSSLSSAVEYLNYQCHLSVEKGWKTNKIFISVSCIKSSPARLNCNNCRHFGVVQNIILQTGYAMVLNGVGIIDPNNIVVVFAFQFHPRPFQPKHYTLGSSLKCANNEGLFSFKNSFNCGIFIDVYSRFRMFNCRYCKI